jgi:hypothetical protein
MRQVLSSIAWIILGMTSQVIAQSTPQWREGAVQGQAVSREVKEIYEKGLEFLVAQQKPNGSWLSPSNPGPGATSLAALAFLAYGEDPNFGAYRPQVMKAIEHLILEQDPKTGYLGGSMYHHGFGTLALAEAYGIVDDRSLWADQSSPQDRRRSIAEALELAIRTSLTSQDRNSSGAWRYGPTSTDADTSVSGAVLVSLIAARNAGIEVPDKNVERAIAYFRGMTSKSGQVAYSGGLGGFDESQARVAIATLVYAIAGQKELKEFQACTDFLKNREDSNLGDHYGEYTAYYKAQALFQAIDQETQANPTIRWPI